MYTWRWYTVYNNTNMVYVFECTCTCMLNIDEVYIRSIFYSARYQRNHSYNVHVSKLHAYVHVHVYICIIIKASLYTCTCTNLGADFQYLALFSFSFATSATPVILIVRGHLFFNFSCRWVIDGIRLLESIFWGTFFSREVRRDGLFPCVEVLVDALDGSDFCFVSGGACLEVVAMVGCCLVAGRAWLVGPVGFYTGFIGRGEEVCGALPQRNAWVWEYTNFQVLSMRLYNFSSSKYETIQFFKF